MDAKHDALKAELAELLHRTAEVACRLQQLEQGRGVPHYDRIESAAHEVGTELSRRVQAQRAGDLAAGHPVETKCPDCRGPCSVTTRSRRVTSIDGPLDLTEAVATCTACRRSFFPSAEGAGARSA